MSDQTTVSLEELLKKEIAETGPMPVSAYMARCLYDPEYGYYRRHHAIGSEGDFVTAPEISQIFGELIGIWVAAVWQQMGTPDKLVLVELGPGRGTMMKDMLRAIGSVPALSARLDVVMVEVSEHLRRAQQATLVDATPPLTWLSSIRELSNRHDGTPVIIVANEFFDALPVTQLVRRGTEWTERAVGLDPDRALSFTEVPNNLPSAPDGLDATDGDIFETRRPAYFHEQSAVASGLSQLAQKAPLALLAIDYGYDGPRIGDTLQAMKRQQYADVLANPGSQDLTAHVDFSELEAVLSDCHLVCDGPISQSAFLAGMAFSARLDALLRGKDARQANAIETAAHRLVAEPGMGVHFRVLAARSRQLPPLVPFPMDPEAA